MKLVIISDVHGSLEQCREAVKLANKKKADIILAGDLINWELKNPHARFVRTLNILKKCRKKVYAIPGSHEVAEEWRLITDFKFGKYQNIIDIHRKIIDLKDFHLTGYGGSRSIIDEIINKAYYVIKPGEDKVFLDKILKKTNKPVILVSHVPPYSYLDTAVFKIYKSRNKRVVKIEPVKKGAPGAVEESVGNKTLKLMVEKHKPLLHVFGHIHESGGESMELITHKRKRESRHLLINSGPSNIFLLDVNKKRAKILGIKRV